MHNIHPKIHNTKPPDTHYNKHLLPLKLIKGVSFANDFANPKSPSLIRKSLVIKILSNLISRCTIPFRNNSRTPRQICRK